MLGNFSTIYVDFVYFDSMVLTDETALGSAFYKPFIKSVKEMGKRSHVFVHVSDPVEAIFMMRELVSTPGYFPFQTTYVQRRRSELSKASLFNNDSDVTYMVTYAFYNSDFIKKGTSDDITIAIKDKLQTRGSLMHFDESEEDEDERSVLFEKSISFFKYLISLFLDPGKCATCFGEGRNFIQALLVSYSFSPTFQHILKVSICYNLE